MDPTASPRERDPLDWTAVITVFFLALVWHRLGTPPQIYFDEIHYVPAARKLLQLKAANPEHPWLGKEAIAAAIWLLGDKPLHWRVPSALCGTLGFFAFGRMMWFASQRRFATLAGLLLLATSFLWFVQSRIAMLDMVMAGLAMVATWMFAAAVRHPAQGRWRLALCGLCLGLSLGAKWSVAPLALLPGLAFLGFKIRDNGWRFLTAKAGGPVSGITLVEAAFWLGTVPFVIYWATFLPTFFFIDRPVAWWNIVGHHKWMLELQDSVKKLHPYRSVWYQWVVDWRAIWFFYSPVDGVQRGILLIGNPFSMIAGLPALLWCVWAAIWRRRWDAGAMALAYLATLGLWVVSNKPIQFYYHYLLPSAFLMACLALALDALWRTTRRWRWLSPGALAAAAGMFVWFYPIISAAKLHHGKKSYTEWMWLRTWR